MRQAARPEHRGALHVVSGPSVKTIRFGRGSVRFAASNIRRDRLGESMLAHDFISRSDFRVASDTMRREGCRFGEALVSMGRLTEDQLNRELAIQAQRIVLSLFRIEEGTYRMETSASADEMPALPFGLPVAPLLLKGLRSIKDGRLILSELPPAETLVRVSPTPPPGFNMDKLSPAERSVLDFTADGRTIGEIIRGTKVGRVDAFHGCFALLSLGLLERVPGPGPEPDPDPQSQQEQELKPPAAHDVSPPPNELEAALATLEPIASPVPPRRTPGKKRSRKEPSYNDLIRIQYQRLEAVSEAGLLGVRDDVSLEELESAYADLKREWTELRQQTDDQSLLFKLDAIERRLAAAYANLRFKCQSAAPASPQLRSLFEAAEAEAEAEARSEKEADAEAKAERDTPIMDAPSQPWVADARVEQLERDLELHFLVRDWSGAMSLLHELVTIHPDNPRYHAQLGTAMQHHSSSRVNAEQHFLEAVRLSPDDPSLRLDLARYYLLMGNPARGRVELQKSLELDPGNEEAQKLLGAGGSPSTMKKLLRRMFGSS